jgi:hypothetical protein
VSLVNATPVGMPHHAVLDEFLLASIQVWEKNSDLKNLTKS